MVEQQTFDLTVMGSNPITLNMRYANHIVLDFENSKKNQNSQYWVFKFVNQQPLEPSFITHVKVLDILISGQTKFNQQGVEESNISNLLNPSELSYNNHLNTTLNLININLDLMIN